jgi:nitroreductase
MKMEIDDFLALVKKRNSVREFKTDPVPEEFMEKIIEAGRWAMSGANGQPWEFVVVKDKNTLKEIAKIYTSTAWSAWTTYEMTRIEEIRQPTVLRDLAGNLPGLKDAPVIIVILGDLRIVQASVLGAAFFTGSTVIMMGLANACQIMHLAAASLGLGSQWVSICPPFEGAIRNLLGIPETFTIQMIMPVGYPAGKTRPRYRRKLSEIVHREKYDMSKFRSDQDIVDYVIKLRGHMRSAYPIGNE